MIVYVNWDNQEIITEEEYNTLPHKGIEDLKADEEMFFDWCNERHINLTDLLYMDSKHQLCLRADWHDYCANEWEVNEGTWERKEIDV